MLILGDFSLESLSEEEELMIVMLHYDVWRKSGAEPGFVDFRESVKAIKVNPVMAAEMLEVTDYLMSIEWRQAEPIPAGLLKESRKLVG